MVATTPQGASQNRPGRRAFFARTAGATAKIGGAAALLALFSTARQTRTAPAALRGDLGLVRPPGSLSEDEFMAACIRCTRCADACETSCIRLVGPEGGKLQGTPYILPIDKACNLCLACGESCPTGAIEILTAKKDARMGTAYVDERLCVSHNGQGVCGACHTVCPLRNTAITQDMRNKPTVHSDHCTGCGLCEEFCIVDERIGLRAIQVKSTRTETPWKARAVT